METRVVIRTPYPKAVFIEGIVRIAFFAVISIESVFIDDRMLFRRLRCRICRFCRRRTARVSAFFRLSFVSICQRRNTFCQGALYQLDQCIRRRAVRFFYLDVEQGVGVRQVLSLYGRGAEARRQYQGGQYGGGAPADAAARALRTAVSQLGYDDVLMFYFTPYDFIYSIHT